MTASPAPAPSPADEGSSPGRPARRGLLRLWRRRRGDAPRRRRLPFELRKALFILPNAFTVASIFCGFYSIALATSGTGPEAFDRAGMMIFLGAFFDGFDGRIARLTRTQSDFGVQMDSLADVMSFGLAPAVLVYNWALQPLGFAGLVISFVFTACGCIRLARFNVLAQRGEGSSKFFVGLPIPGAATMLVSVIMVQSQGLGTTVEQHGAVVALVLILSYLMVSRIPFRTFKDVRPRMQTLPLILGVIVALVGAVLLLKARLALVFAIGTYVALGLVEEVVFFGRRRNEREAERAARAAAASSTAPS